MNVGDRVRITDPGKTYNTYDTMFKIMKFINKKLNKFSYKEDVGIIFSIANHLRDDNRLLCGVNLLNGEQCLIDLDGLELIKEEIYECW